MTSEASVAVGSEAERPTVAIHSGSVRGVCRDDVCSFLGIPYAAPPFGENRFEPPVSPTQWGGIRDASSFGPSAPQPAPSSEIALLPRPDSWGEDCLTVNVWAPAAAENAPVMVFVHGGSFVSGGASLPTYDGSAFARDGVVLVSMNYRLGAEGFMFTGEGSANLGLLDQVAALAWVRDNIGAFGGDPGNVTIFGESAGAMSVCALMAMPSAAGLFHRAIAQSGSADIALPVEDALRVTRRLAEILGVPAARDAIAGLPMDRVLAAQQQVGEEVSANLSVKRWGAVARQFMPFEPVIDGVVLPELPRTAIARGASQDVDLMIGTNTDEANLFFVPNGATRRFSLPIAWFLARRYRAKLSRLRGSYRARGHRTSADLTLALLTDAIYRVPALRLARQHPRTHVYEFAWNSPAFDGGLGACHALELPFVFDTLDEPGLEMLLGGRPPEGLARTMHAAWVAFASDGDPGWPRCTAAEPHSMRFDDRSRAIRDASVDEAVWPDLLTTS